MKLNRLFSVLLLGTVLVTTGQGCGSGDIEAAQLEEVEVEIWRVFDDNDTFDDIVDAYTTQHPNVRIIYREMRYEEYEEELLNAFAKGEGPDILSLHNTWLPAYQDLLEPMPETTTVTYQEVRGSVRKEVSVVSRSEQTISSKTLKDSYVDQVAEDVILWHQADPELDPEERIYGLPLAMDSLALFYNKDLLNAAGIASPPETWSEFQEQVTLLTTYDSTGELEQSGAALGTAENVERATDILSLLMMQNGTEMTDDRGRVAFHSVPDDAPKGVYPGLDATYFYLDFADPTKEVYTWNDTYESSFEAFANGQTAFFLGYSYHIPLLQTTAPKLNFSITYAPQIEGGRQVNYANYWVETVSAQTEVSDWAWNFLTFAADAENVVRYLEEARRPTALRALISEQIEDEQLGIFAEQTLTAVSWYQGYDVTAAEEALKDMIIDLAAGPEDPDDVIYDAANRVSQTYSE